MTGDDVAEPKPHPEVYRRALAELGLPAAEALAVEDSAIGLRAAVAAGLATIVVTNGYTAYQDFAGAAAVLSAMTGRSRCARRSVVRCTGCGGAGSGTGRGQPS